MRMRTPSGFLAIIVAFRNEESSLAASLESIRTQTVRPEQVILVDDGSSDASSEFAKAYSDRYGWIFLSITQKGVAAARNLALDHVSTEYVTFLDADDILLPFACQLLLHTAHEHHADVVFGGIAYFDRWKRVRPIPYLERWTTEGFSVDLRAIPEAAIDIPMVIGKLFRVSILEKHDIRFPLLRYRSDCVFSAETWAAADTYRALDRYIYVKRPIQRYSPGLTDQKGIRVVSDRLKAMDLIDQALNLPVSEVVRAYNHFISIGAALLSVTEIEELSERSRALCMLLEKACTCSELEDALKKSIGLSPADLASLTIEELTPTWYRYHAAKTRLSSIR